MWRKSRVFSGRLQPGPGGGARGVSRRRRGSPGVARRLRGGPVLIRAVKYVVSAAWVRQSVVNLHISQGGPGGVSGGPDVSVPVGKPTSPPSRFGRSDGLGVRNLWVCTCFPTCLATRSGRPGSTPSGAEGLAGAHPVDSIRPESNPNRQICIWPRNPVLRPCGPPRVRPLLPERWLGSRPAGHCSPREDFVRPESNPNKQICIWPRNPALRPCGPPRVRPLLPENWRGPRPAGHFSPREDFTRPESNPNRQICI